MRTRIRLMTRLAWLPLLVLMQGGCKNVLGFSTATKFGLDISQRPDQTLDVSFGYDRTEIASIPAPKNEDAGEDVDTYSVLGTFAVSYGNPFAGEPLVLDQWFATGMAAQRAAKDPKFQTYFGQALGEVVKENKTTAAPAGGP